jgi:exodeoxyribonuclease VII large subunit
MKNLFSYTDTKEDFKEKEVYSVSSLRDKLSIIVKSSFPYPILVSGVISSNPKLYPSFFFFDLKDEKKNMFFTMYGNIQNYYKIERKLKELKVVNKLSTDIPVMLFVKPIISTQKQISVRLNVIDIVPEYTKEKLMSKKDETIKKLTEEGIVDLQKNLKVPSLIRRIGLITSDQGTSVQDIKTSMKESVKFFDIVFKSVRVEGKSAIPSIVSAIKEFNKHQKKLGIDLIIIARGGGSQVDLEAFNSYEVCSEVCQSKIPIFTAIGHDKDELAIELCSNTTPIPSTPSGLGEHVRNLIMEVKEDFEVILNNVQEKILETFKNEESKILRHINTVKESHKRIVKINLLKIENFIKNIKKDIKAILKTSEEKLKSFKNIIKAYDYKNVLKRGYAVIFNKDGKTIKTAKTKENKFNIKLYDGSISVIKEKED